MAYPGLAALVRGEQLPPGLQKLRMGHIDPGIHGRYMPPCTGSKGHWSGGWRSPVLDFKLEFLCLIGRSERSAARKIRSKRIRQAGVRDSWRIARISIMKVVAFMRKKGLVSRRERPSVISAIGYIIDQMRLDKEPIALGLDDGEIVVQGCGRRSLGIVCRADGLNFSCEDVLRAEQSLAESLPA
jgi:hypothetical protein